jgi:hypothetical protein
MRLKQKALGSIPGSYPGIFSLPYSSAAINTAMNMAKESVVLYHSIALVLLYNNMTLERSSPSNCHSIASTSLPHIFIMVYRITQYYYNKQQSHSVYRRTYIYTHYGYMCKLTHA